jgi:AraC-like DNA-binding protein
VITKVIETWLAPCVSEKPHVQLNPGGTQRLDPLSEILALMKPEIHGFGGLMVPGDVVIHFPQYQGITCCAMLVGQCWLIIDGVPEPVLLHAGDCFLLPHGRPFRLATDLSLKQSVPATFCIGRSMRCQTPEVAKEAGYIAGGQFALTGDYPETFLHSLPPIIHIHSESGRAAMKWSLERMREEFNDQQPGGSLIVQQLAYVMLMQVLRLSSTDTAGSGPSWLSGLSDTHMSVVIASMHKNPGYPWTLRSLAERAGMSRSVFAVRFRATVGSTPMEYLTSWRMLLAADRLKNSSEGLSSIARSLSYKSESAFGKAFRRLMGCSPKQYARRKTTELE